MASWPPDGLGPFQAAQRRFLNDFWGALSFWYRRTTGVVLPSLHDAGFFPCKPLRKPYSHRGALQHANCLRLCEIFCRL